MDTLFQDLRYALRQFARRPGFTAVAVLSLGLAIGGNSLIYGMLDGFVFRPFPYPEPDRLVAVGVAFPKLSAETTYVEALSPVEYLDIRTNRSFAHVGSFDLGNRNISGGDVPERVFTALLLDDLFPVIGMAPVLGRGFTPEELGPNGPPAAIISYRLWQSRFGGDPAILNRSIRVSGRAASIVGVMPPGLVLIGTDLWIPWGGDPLTMPRNVRQFNVLARLRSWCVAGTGERRAGGDRPARRAVREAEVRGVRQLALDRDAVGGSAPPGRAPGGIRPARRRRSRTVDCLREPHEPVSRAILDAPARAGRAPGARCRALAADAPAADRERAACRRRRRGRPDHRVGRTEERGALIPGQFQMLGLEASVNVRVLMWSLALALVSGVLVGLLPALQATRTDPHESLKADARSGGSRAGRHLRHVLIVGELALSVVLLLGAGLLLRSFLNIQRVDRGFDSQGRADDAPDAAA